METLKKKHVEILALYKLEKDIKDLYVEGNTDRVFFEYYLKNKKCNKKIITAEVIDFSELPKEYSNGLDLNSNRNKLLVLSKLFNDNLPSTNARCIVDKDFDDYIKIIDNNKLLKTDFSCLEAYLYCEEVIDKFINIGIGNFPFKASFIINQLACVLKPLFCLRLLREIKFASAKLLDIDGNLSIDKKSGTINFDTNDYLDKFILKNNLTSKRKDIHDSFIELDNKLNLEIRHHIHGHDFLNIFFLYVNKIKNTHKFKEENFPRSLFLSVETPMLENYPLFKNIVK